MERMGSEKFLWFYNRTLILSLFVSEGLGPVHCFWIDPGSLLLDRSKSSSNQLETDLELLDQSQTTDPELQH